MKIKKIYFFSMLLKFYRVSFTYLRLEEHVFFIQEVVSNNRNFVFSSGLRTVNNILQALIKFLRRHLKHV